MATVDQPTPLADDLAEMGVVPLGFRTIAAAAWRGWGVLLFPLGWGIAHFAGMVYNIAQVSYRQSVTPPRADGPDDRRRPLGRPGHAPHRRRPRRGTGHADRGAARALARVRRVVGGRVVRVLLAATAHARRAST
ncbi:hypothetical protein [Streptomyces murinus]|uniref:hypothetical protein n=1 Tax=Streptomyces murinus TaxID=33900 RepID=UPI0037F3A92F